ncbi:MAG: type IV pilus secretin PilQ [Thermodesulfobacteriota bacterium]|nr:type IV pilus secretin PilQ [Thermodesulfobacteriota bacterium]
MTIKARKSVKTSIIGFLVVLLVGIISIGGCASTKESTLQDAESQGLDWNEIAPQEATAATETAEPASPSVEDSTVSSSAKLITGVDIQKTPEGVSVAITANHVPDYTIAEPPLEQSTVIYFPEAGLGMAKTEFSTDSSLIGKVSAVELIKDGPSKIVIPMKSRDIDYEAERGRDQHVMRIAFKKTAGVADIDSGTVEPVTYEESATSDKESMPEDELIGESGGIAEATVPSTTVAGSSQSVDTAPSVTAAAGSAEAAMPAVTMMDKKEEDVEESPDEPAEPASSLIGIDVETTGDNGIAVIVQADGTIEAHKSFTLPEPPRIVFDLPGISSSFDKEQRIMVDSDIVKRIRHFSHPDYLRVVLDVNKDYLSDFQTASRRDGFLIQVGEPAAMPVETPEEAEAVMVAETASTATAEEMPREEASSADMAMSSAMAPGASAETMVTASGSVEAAGAVAGAEVMEMTSGPDAESPAMSAAPEAEIIQESGQMTDDAQPEAAEMVSMAQEMPEEPASAAMAAESQTQAMPDASAETVDSTEVAPAAASSAMAASADQEAAKQGGAATTEQATPGAIPGESEPAVITKQYDRPALVNKINFIEQQQGESTLEIGTTHPVNFEIEKTDDKKLRMVMENTNILSFRQRPLITTRFDSAVDLINPIQTRKMKQKKVSFIYIDLREDVPFQATRAGKTIRVDFAASSVAPDPAKKITIPVAHELEIEEPAKPEEKEMAEVEEKSAQAIATAPEGEALGGTPSAGEEEPVEIRPEPEPMELSPDFAEAYEPEEGPIEIAETPPEAMMPGKKPKYTGEPIALDFYKTDIRNVIRILKDVSGKNFAIDKDVEGSVTLSFVNPVPWDQVLDLILEMNDLGMVEDDGIIRIATQETLRRQKEAAQAALVAQQQLKQKEEELAPLQTEYFAISYSEAGSDILPHLEPLLTARGHVKVDSRTNQVIMTDVAERIEKATEIISKIDKVTPQVMIKARIVETTTNFAREFGTEWGWSNSPGTYRDDWGGTLSYDVAMNNLASTVNTLGINFARLVGTPFSLDARLSLMESSGEVKIISTPKIMTLDNKEAAISQGQEIPYTTVDDGEADTKFKDANLELKVTPHVTPDNRISMKINIVEKELGETGVSDEPPINTKEALTELLVNDGDTVVIGGILQETKSEGSRGLPWLRHIPLLGKLFSRDIKRENKSELLIFITPTVVRLD